MDQQVVSSRFPYLPLKVTVRGRSEDVEALLDTGFDGDLLVPDGFIADVRPPDGNISWVLADGSHGEAPSYRGNIEIGTLGSFPATILVLGREVLVGRRFTDRFAITLDHGQKVIVEP